ncbi:YeaC family protein [Ferrimonas sp.]|uniref:YeaC family protein n=1 Tax=Ferrimonas sp. TaxID=2080861 RepID=UPI003A8F2241
MEWQTLAANMDAELAQKLQTAVEIGKWPDGTLVTDEQREAAMQALIVWQSNHNSENQHLTVGRDGEINHLSKDVLKHQFDDNQITRLKPE